MRSARRWLVCGAGGFLLLSLTSAQVAAQTTIKQAPAQRIQSVEGVDTYNAYCAVCHGPKRKATDRRQPRSRRCRPI